MLTTRRFVAAVLAGTLTALTAVVAGTSPAGADPTDPGCGIATCPTGPPGGDPTVPTNPPVVGDAPGGSCTTLAIPVDPADLVGQVPPVGVPGGWAYQLCGDPGLLAGLPPTARTPAAIREYCAPRACSLLTFWKPTNPDPPGTIDLKGDDNSFFAFAKITPDAQSSPNNGRVITNFPTWFYDNHDPWTVVGAPFPAIPLGDMFGGFATAIHLESWWTVDGRRVCDNKGVKPSGQITRAQALQTHDCGAVFTTTGPHTATASETWLIIVVNFVPPLFIAFTLTFNDDVAGLFAREVQTDSQ